METKIQRDSRSKIDELSSSEIPSAPNLPDQVEINNVVEEENQDLYFPERQQNNDRFYLWTKLRQKFTNYRRMKEMNESETNANHQIHPNDQSPYRQITPNSTPDPIFGDLKIRNNILRKIYILIISQLSFFTFLCGLFYYSPHLRKIFRKTFADKIFLKSMFGFGPLGILLIGAFFLESIRRKYAKFLFLTLTAILSCLLCYFMSSEANNQLIFVEMALSDGCFVSMQLLNLVFPKFSLQNRSQTLFFPAFMLASQGLQPLLIKKHSTSNYIKSIFFVGATSYLGYNSGSVLNNRRLALKENEISFAAMQTYVNLNPLERIFSKFRSRQTNFQPI